MIICRGKTCPANLLFRDNLEAPHSEHIFLQRDDSNKPYIKPPVMKMYSCCLKGTGRTEKKHFTGNWLSRGVFSTGAQSPVHSMSVNTTVPGSALCPGRPYKGGTWAHRRCGSNRAKTTKWDAVYILSIWLVVLSIQSILSLCYAGRCWSRTDSEMVVVGVFKVENKEK